MRLVRWPGNLREIRATEARRRTRRNGSSRLRTSKGIRRSIRRGVRGRGRRRARHQPERQPPAAPPALAARAGWRTRCPRPRPGRGASSERRACSSGRAARGRAALLGQGVWIERRTQPEARSRKLCGDGLVLGVSVGVHAVHRRHTYWSRGCTQRPRRVRVAEGHSEVRHAAAVSCPCTRRVSFSLMSRPSTAILIPPSISMFRPVAVTITSASSSLPDSSWSPFSVKVSILSVTTEARPALIVARNGRRRRGGGDLFETISAGRASVVTDRIEPSRRKDSSSIRQRAGGRRDRDRHQA